jgi:Protein of unknown function (DUF3489)
MTTYTIDTENTIIAFNSPKDAEKSIAGGAQPFTTQTQFEKLTAEWPISRFAESWNSFAAVAGFGAELRPVKKFTDRKTAIKRIWTAIQKLDSGSPEPATTETAPVAPRAAKGAPKRPNTAKGTRGKAVEPTAREGSKRAIIMGMLVKGATLSDLMAATGWQAHSVRGFLSTVAKKQGITIESTRNKDGQRFYKISK